MGVLYYKGRKVDPAKFKAKGRDLHRLKGVCGCGAELRGRAAIPRPDPYQDDVFGDKTPDVECEDCLYESMLSI